MEVSINRALSSLKLLTKKITDKTGELVIASIVKYDTMSPDDKTTVLTSYSSNVQAIKDMMTQRNRIKTAIVASNAVTMIEVAGESYTVARAIERKTSIELEKNLNRQMRESYYSNKSALERHNDQCRAKADQSANAALGAGAEGDKGEQYKAVFSAYYDMNKAEMIAPPDAEVVIKKDGDRIADFENDIDFLLSESNTKTMITV